MSQRLSIVIRNLQKKLPINQTKIKSALRRAFLKEGAGRCGEISVCVITDKEIKKLNRKYLRHNCPTDVISFDISNDPKKIQAEIAVSADTAIKNAKAFNTAPAYELRLYIIHGLLHTLGYNDRTDKLRSAMNKRSEEYL